MSDTLKDTLWRARFGEAPPADLANADLTRLAGFLNRRSCRAFRPEPIEPGLLTALLACAQSAPSKSDLQQFSIIVIDDPEIRERMQEWSSFDPWIADAPVFLVFCGDVRRQRRISGFRGYPHRNDNLDCFMNTAVDAGIALATFVNAAEASGLGCCPISVVRNHIEEACALFALPDGVYPVAGLALGWPARDGYVSMRLPPRAVVHRNRYDDSDLEAAVGDYDRARHAVYAIPPEKQRHRDKYGTSDVCTWSENAARQESVSERAAFRAFLQAHGFALE